MINLSNVVLGARDCNNYALFLKALVHLYINIYYYYFFISRSHLSFASAARSLCLLFLNQLLTCVVVNPVASASSRFSRGDG